MRCAVWASIPRVHPLEQYLPALWGIWIRILSYKVRETRNLFPSAWPVSQRPYRNVRIFLTACSYRPIRICHRKLESGISPARSGCTFLLAGAGGILHAKQPIYFRILLCGPKRFVGDPLMCWFIFLNRTTTNSIRVYQEWSSYTFRWSAKAYRWIQWIQVIQGLHLQCSVRSFCALLLVSIKLSC